MERERPDFEFDEFFYDDEDEQGEELLTPAKSPDMPQADPEELPRKRNERDFSLPEEQEPAQPVAPKPLQEELPPAMPQRPDPVPMEKALEPVPERPPVKSEPPVHETEALSRGVRVRGKIRKRVDPESILPQIHARVDDVIVYMYESGMLEDAPQQEPVVQPAPQEMQPAAAQTAHLAPQVTDSTMPLNAKAAPQPGASYVLVDTATHQMIAVEGNLRVGRDPSYADLVPPGNNTVSAQHAELTVKQNVLIVRDVGANGEGSSNGTFINGAKIPMRSMFGVEAREGDIIEFSDAKYRVERL